MMKKFIFLILTLAIPVSIFLFLKIFGNNEFEVPVFFENGIPGCPESTKPHQVSLAGLSLDNLSGILNGDLIFGVLAERDSSKLHDRVIQLVRIQDAFYETGSPTFVLLTDQKDYSQAIISQFEEVGLLAKNYQLIVEEQEAADLFLKCELGIEDGSEDKLVLVDPGKRVRGIYDGLELDQTEQLILELKILREQEK